MNVKYRVIKADVDESVYTQEAPGAYVCRIAAKKARWVSAQSESALHVLAADTAVVVNDVILGKPANPEQAKKMLRSLSGRTHQVFSAVVLITAQGVETERLNISQVTMSNLDADWVEAYCETAEPMDKAGAYAIQGLAAQWITRLEGSYSGVMGLPLFETMELLRQAGIQTVSELT